jgi:hypothetical protein
VSGETREITAQRVLATVPRWVLDDLLGEAHEGERPESATASASMLIRRLPRIAGSTPSELAFGGTFRRCPTPVRRGAHPGYAALPHSGTHAG